MKNDVKALFAHIPDTVFITDRYGYILDFNRAYPFERVKKGSSLKDLIPDFCNDASGEFRSGDRTFKRQTAEIEHKGDVVGYTVMLSDLTDEYTLNEQLRRQSEKLKALTDDLKRSNEELEAFAMQVKELSGYAEQLRIAGVIHDDLGHTVTELNALCRMCLKLKDTDRDEYEKLLSYGISVCRSAGSDIYHKEYSSLPELLSSFCRLCRFPVDVKINGDEPDFIRDKYKTVENVLREAYHNTLDHSLADKLFVTLHMDSGSVKLDICDNGSFHGVFEKGFGLTSMENNVRSTGGEIEFSAETGRGFEIKIVWRSV